jgi:glucose/arabinose dehydrogenase
VPFQARSAPLRLTFYDADAFPAEYKGSAFEAFLDGMRRGSSRRRASVRALPAGSGPPLTRSAASCRSGRR